MPPIYYDILILISGVSLLVALALLAIELVKFIYRCFNKSIKSSLNTKTKSKFILIIIVFSIFILITSAIAFFELHAEPSFSTGCEFPRSDQVCKPSWKPVIYLYPEAKQKIKVQLEYVGELIADYPSYDHSINGWEIVAYPDGMLIDPRDEREYSYPFWEGVPDSPQTYDWSHGFVVAGSDTRDFLQEILPQIGLTPKEYNEFIVYWYPKMMANPYNLIHFASDEEYSDSLAPLTVNPQPENILWVYMVYQALTDRPAELPIPQVFTGFDRSDGLTLVEWGGSEL